MGEKEAYSQAVDEGYIAECTAKIQRRFFKRFPIDLPDEVEPTPEELASCNGDVTAARALPDVRERRLGGLRLSSGPDSGASAGSIADALVEGVRTNGLSLLPWSDGAGAYRARAAYAGVPLDDETLIARLDDWLPALVAGKRRLDAITPGALTEAIRNLIDWNDQRRIDSVAPSHFTSPAGKVQGLKMPSIGEAHFAVDRAAGGDLSNMAGQTLFLLPDGKFVLPNYRDGWKEYMHSFGNILEPETTFRDILCSRERILSL